jgi:prepilin peptidase CpaA
MVSVSTVLLLVLTAIATATDLAYHKIYNWTTYPGIVAGLAVNLLEHGWDEPGGLRDSLFGFALCGTVMLVAFVFFNIGGGDVKLMAMQGAFLGVERGIEALLWTFVLGGVVGLSILIWRVGVFKLVTGTVRHVLLSLRVVSWVPLTEDERKQLQPPLYLAPAAFLAVVIVCFNLVRFF